MAKKIKINEKVIKIEDETKLANFFVFLRILENQENLSTLELLAKELEREPEETEEEEDLVITKEDLDAINYLIKKNINNLKKLKQLFLENSVDKFYFLKIAELLKKILIIKKSPEIEEIIALASKISKKLEKDEEIILEKIKNGIVDDIMQLIAKKLVIYKTITGDAIIFYKNEIVSIVSSAKFNKMLDLLINSNFKEIAKKIENSYRNMFLLIDILKNELNVDENKIMEAIMENKNKTLKKISFDSKALEFNVIYKFLQVLIQKYIKASIIKFNNPEKLIDLISTLIALIHEINNREAIFIKDIYEIKESISSLPKEMRDLFASELENYYFNINGKKIGILASSTTLNFTTKKIISILTQLNLKAYESYSIRFRTPLSRKKITILVLDLDKIINSLKSLEKIKAIEEVINEFKKIKEEVKDAIPITTIKNSIEEDEKKELAETIKELLNEIKEKNEDKK